MHFGRSASSLVAISLFAVAALGCASKNDTSTTPGATADAGTTPPADTNPPVEDTAPWNTYPSEPYGLEKGAIFPNITLSAYRDGAGEWVEIKMQDYFDPDGTRGITGILYVVSAEWCPPCREEAKDLPGMYEKLYKPRGARFITGMIENSSSKPADQPTVDRWIKMLKTAGVTQNFDIGIDPTKEAMPKTGSVGIPRNYLINPRNMQIVRVNSGANPEATTVPGLTPLLDYNGAPKAP